MKKILVSVTLVGVLACAVLFLRCNASADKADPAAPATKKVERGAIRLTVASTGKIVSNLDVDIKCKASGEIIKLQFDVSDTVKKGDPLMEIDPVDEQRNVLQAEVAVSASEAKLKSAQETLAEAERSLVTDGRRADLAIQSCGAKAVDSRAKADRIKKLLDQKLASTEEFETANTAAVLAAAEEDLARVKKAELETQKLALEKIRQDVRLADAQVKTNEIARDIARQRLVDTKVVAPMDGTVTARSVQIGQIISSGISNVGGGTTAMTLSDLSRIFALASVDESDIGKIKLNQSVTTTVDAFPGKRFMGQVLRIATKGVNVSNVVTFEVKIEILSEEKSLLKPEMTANVEILVDEKKDVLLVPADSILRREGKLYVTVVKDKDQPNDDRVVETGITDGQKTEVASGLSEGDVVVVRKNDAASRWKNDRQPSMFGPPRVRGR